MDPTRDTTSNQTLPTNNPTGNMASPRSRTRAYDAEGSALQYWIDRLQRLCAGRTDVEAMREATKTLGLKMFSLLSQGDATHILHRRLEQTES
ncbi:hypothetical protein T01_13629 [Trichinella spiralis]|uniref:Uncharacterized protein n=1 Tax=Trichinella spiralis TaxID=6334 RepID=A0A0V1BHR5_TRISP|nr:hypothetical protein T01_13629 [Trichinella spiralis]